MNHSFYRISITCLLSIVLFNCNNQTARSKETKVDSTGTGEKAVAANHPVFEKLLGTWQLEDGKTYERYPWSTPLSSYREFEAHRLASRGEAIWSTPVGDYGYGRFELVSVRYNL